MSRRTRWGRLALRTVSKAWHDRILGLSAEAAFWQLLSTPSLVLALLAVLGYFAELSGPATVSRVQTDLLDACSRAFSPEVVNEIIAPTVAQVLKSGRADIVSVGFVLALWAGSSATATFVNTITIAYDMRDLRGAVRSRLLALWIYVGSILIGVILLPALVLGPQFLSDVFPTGVRSTAHQVIKDAYWPLSVVLLLFALASLYHLAPPRRLPWRRGVPGAVLAMIVFTGGSAGLRAYINFVLSHNHAYGTLAAPIAALLFFYVLAVGVHLGAELNAAIEEVSPTARRRDDRRWRELPDPTATTRIPRVAGPRPSRIRPESGPMRHPVRSPHRVPEEPQEPPPGGRDS